MKQFYSCECKNDLNMSKRNEEWVEYDINTLIHFTAECEIEGRDEYMDISDDEFVELSKQRAKEIKAALMRNGIYRNEFGQPLFLYC